MAVVNGLMYDARLDFAILEIEQQDPKAEPFFDVEYHADDTEPRVGDEVVVLGYSEMEVREAERFPNGHEFLSVAMRPMLRAG
jgi:hypothetical protein